MSEIAQGVTVDFTDRRQAENIILESIRDLDIKCVLATDDSCVSLSNQIAKTLNLAHNQSSATLLTHRKDLARKAAQAGSRHN